VGPGNCSYSSAFDGNHPWVQQAAERTQLMVDTGTVPFPVPVDVLPALAHRSYNNPVLIALGRWNYERVSQLAKLGLVTLYKKSSKQNEN
jgi:hypothetical protein